MSALPDDQYPVAADTAAAPSPDPASEAEVRNLYAIPRPAPEPEQSPEDDDGVLARMWEQFTPPRFWSEPTPSPAEEFNRAQHGRHLQSSGPMRTAAIGYAAISGAWNTKDKAKIWVRSHPARTVTVGLLLVGLLLSPARPVVATLLFGLPHLLYELLT